MLNYASYCVLKASKVLMFCQDFYAQLASGCDKTKRDEGKKHEGLSSSLLEHIRLKPPI